MKIHFLGAAQTVTGSCYLVEGAGRRVLVDCGFFQGRHEKWNRRPFPFDPRGLDLLILTHAHLDHIGRSPRLAQQGYRGPVVASPATLELATPMLMDAAHIAREERRHRPLFESEDVTELLSRPRPVPYYERVELLPGLAVTLHDAGHILGSSHVALEVQEKGHTRTVVFSGDIGALDRPILEDPTLLDRADAVVMETTYGNRCHRPAEDTDEELREIIAGAHAGGGVVLVPAFSLGRTQELIYRLGSLVASGRLPHTPIYVDSPLAISITEVYRNNPDCFDGDARLRIWGGDDIFDFPGLRYVRHAGESRRITRKKAGIVIIASAGMCQAGRIRHHLARHLPHRQCHVVICGYQAEGTPGRALVNGTRQLGIHGKRVPVRAQIHTLGGFSAHADAPTLERWIRSFDPPPRHILLTHGEPHAQEAFQERISAFGLSSTIPEWGDTLEL